ncbi:hypothetical protein EG349_00690 [Chryseobacterium shandongense]|uniref:Uncharacterized protein n=1 Tax=Chryseobacterium shandongense TaxID=1493872 RepID=A0AAD1DKI2_9FLAO|nr:hypothetical protein EG349_00690 [Chryseobacterium shandongense]AZA97520.1 hypothetical protein EG353_19160 [Chryseobacterium shandongense]
MCPPHFGHFKKPLNGKWLWAIIFPCGLSSQVFPLNTVCTLLKSDSEIKLSWVASTRQASSSL